MQSRPPWLMQRVPGKANSSFIPAPDSTIKAVPGVFAVRASAELIGDQAGDLLRQIAAAKEARASIKGGIVSRQGSPSRLLDIL